MVGNAAIRNTTGSGAPLFRTDPGNIQLLVNTSVSAGSKNANGQVDIIAGSNVMQALTQAAGEWNAVSTAAVHFASLETGTTSNNPTDAINVITIQDTAENRSLVGDLLAVTVYEYEPNGAITDTDIILNPDITMNGQQMPFSTTHALGTFDLQSVVAHEMGHTLGSDHSGLLSASMVPSIPPNDSFVGAPKTPLGAALSTDDIAFVSGVYPSSKAAQLGSIQGTVTAGGQAVSGAAVIAVSPSTGRSVCALSAADGTYTIPALPVDSYVVYAQPLDGPVRTGNIYSLAGRAADTSFQTTFFGGNAAPAHLNVTAGSVSQASISAASGSPSLALPLVAVGTPDLNSWSWSGGANTVQAGQTLALLLTGAGIDSSITADDIDLLGPGLTVQSVQPAGFDINGLPALAVLVNIANESMRGEATIVVHKGSEAAAYSGGLIIAPDSTTSSAGGPSFTAAGMKNAASYQAGTVAPGEIFALFGSGLGPTSPAGFSLNAQNQMPTTLGGTEVLFDGVAAPLIYSVSGQVLGIVPYSVGGQTSVVVSYKGASSSAVTIPVSSSVPGLFTKLSGGSGPASILNWLSKTGMSVNSEGDPALRGGMIVAYGTGDGFSYGFPVGTLAGSGPNESASVTATIGGVPAKVTYAGAATGQIVGLFQVNIQVPSNAPTGAQPLYLTVNGARSQAGVTVAVQ
jgi:uncharacterized protein (TIGR03437 family)